MKTAGHFTTQFFRIPIFSRFLIESAEGNGTWQGPFVKVGRDSYQSNAASGTVTTVATLARRVRPVSPLYHRPT